LSNHSLAGLGQLEDITIEARVFRCKCGQPDTHSGEPCPVGKWEPAQTVAHWQEGDPPTTTRIVTGSRNIIDWMKGLRP
jgi:hypothetical protein